MGIRFEEISTELTLPPFIRKIMILKSEENASHTQVLTKSPFCYLSYTRGNKPKISINPSCDADIQIVGPKCSSDISIEYAGEFEQLLIEFTLFGFYEVFQKSPKKFVNQCVDYSVFCDMDFSIDKNSSMLNVAYSIIRKLSELYISSVPEYAKKSQKIIDEMSFSPNLPNQMELPTGDRNLRRVFNHYAGITPKKYHQILRLQKIVRQLFVSDASAKESLNVTEFTDFPHLIKFFILHTGSTPRRFKNCSDLMPLKKQYFLTKPS